MGDVVIEHYPRVGSSSSSSSNSGTPTTTMTTTTKKSRTLGISTSQGLAPITRNERDKNYTDGTDPDTTNQKGAPRKLSSKVAPFAGLLNKAAARG